MIYKEQSDESGLLFDFALYREKYARICDERRLTQGGKKRVKATDFYAFASTCIQVDANDADNDNVNVNDNDNVNENENAPAPKKSI